MDTAVGVKKNIILDDSQATVLVACGNTLEYIATFYCVDTTVLTNNKIWHHRHKQLNKKCIIYFLPRVLESSSIVIFMLDANELILQYFRY
jgi:hypothetical protein